MNQSQNPKIIVILGRAGSGKGTQAKLLIEKFKLEYFGSGDSLRTRQAAGDYTAKKLIEVMAEGKLVPSFVISKIWIDKLESLKQEADFNGFVFDGSPRKIIEAQYLDEALSWYDWKSDFAVVLIDISEKEAFNRLTKRRACQKCGNLIPYIGEFKNLKTCNKCGGELVMRPDDKMSAIKKRLSEFKKEVVPVIDHYKKQKRLVKVKGEQSIEKVFQDILKNLK